MAEDPPAHFWIPRERVSVERFAPTGGGRPIARDDFGAHGRSLLAQYAATRDVLASKVDSELTDEVIVQVTTPADVPVRQEKLRLRNLGFEILSYSARAENRANTLIARGDFERLRGRITRYAEEPSHPGKSTLAVIEEISDVPPEDKLEPEFLELAGAEPQSCLVTLYAALSTREKVAVSQAVSRWLEPATRAGARIRSFANETFAIAARLTADQALDLATRFASIRSIKRNGRAVVTRSTPISQLPPNLRVEAAQSQAPVVVVDSGIHDASGPLRGLVIAQRVQLPIGSSTPELAHGTFVASRIAFGDDLEEALSRGVLVPQCPLIDVAVFGIAPNGDVMGPEEDELIDVLEQAVADFRDQSRIFNLSLGFDSAVRDGEFSELAKNLDFLAREYDILFVIAAGNISNPVGPHPEHFLHDSARIQPPAEALLGLSVGAVARHEVPSAISRANEVSAFSCRGPGADRGLKPELVAHGGNLLATWTSSPRIGTFGLSALGDQLAYDVGTSFAAPLIAQMASRLAIEYPSGSTNLIKALLCHFSEPVSCPSVAGVESCYLTGLGSPDVGRALNASNHSVAFLYEGELVANTYQHVPFFVPATLAENSGRALRIRTTVVYNPPVDPDNPDEYSKARIVCSLHKRVDVGFRQVTLAPTDLSLGKPWNPLIHFAKSFSRQYSTGDWELRLRLMTRGGLPGSFAQRFALVVEVIDDSGTTDVRRDVLAEAADRVQLVRLRSAA